MWFENLQATNHEDALQFAYMKRAESNLARCYIELARKSDWQPIETAPKDGTPILVWVDMHGEHVTGVPYACVAYFGGDWWRDRRTGQFLVGRPAHWQHLPEPPK